MPGCWIPLLDFAMKNGVSLSTLRRHIKAGKLEYRVEDGRYLLFDPTGEPTATAVAGAGAVAGIAQPSQTSQTSGNPAHAPAGANVDRTTHSLARAQLKVFELERDLEKAKEEIAELKTLIAYYEELIAAPSPTRRAGS